MLRKHPCCDGWALCKKCADGYAKAEAERKKAEDSRREDWMSDAQWECVKMLAAVVCGHHHLRTPKPFGNGVKVIFTEDLSTFDRDRLTRLVLLAHERAIRVTVQTAGMYLCVVAFYRGKREGAIHERHPTIEEAVSMHGCAQLKERDAIIDEAMRLLEVGDGVDVADGHGGSYPGCPYCQEASEWRYGKRTLEHDDCPYEALSARVEEARRP